MIFATADLCWDEPSKFCVIDTANKQLLLCSEIIEEPLEKCLMVIAGICRDFRPAELWVSSPFGRHDPMRLRELLWQAGVPKAVDGGPVMGFI